MGDAHVDRAAEADRAPVAEPVDAIAARAGALTSAARAARVTPSSALALQRAAGNRATGRWLARTRRLARSTNAVDPRPLQLEVNQEREVYMATEYAVIPRPDGGTDLEAVYWASFTVEGDSMIISVRTRLADGTRSPTLRFSDQFDKAMAWFAGQGVDVRTIETEWSYMTPTEKSSNLSEYESLRAEGLSREAAAGGTPSGRLLAAKGWRLAEIGPTRFESHEHLSPTFGPDAVEPAERILYPTQRAKWVRATASTTGTPLAGAGTPPAAGEPPAGAASFSAVRPATTGARPTAGPRVPASPLPNLELVPPANVKRASPLPNLELVPPANVKRASPLSSPDLVLPANLPPGPKPPGVAIGPAAASGLRSDLAAGVRSGAVSGGVALFGVLTSIGRQRFDRWISEQQLQDLEPEIARRLNEMLPNGLALRATDPGKPVYANIAIRTSQPSTFEAETGGRERRYDLPIVRLHSVGFSHEPRERTRRWQEWHATFRIDWSETVSSVLLDALVGPAEPPVCEP